MTIASGMNLFNLIRFEKYDGGREGDPSLRAIENSNSTLRLSSKNNREGGRVEDAFKRTFKRSEKKGERERPPARGTDSLDSSAGVKSKRRAPSRARDTRGTRDRDGKGKKERGRGGGGG